MLKQAIPTNNVTKEPAPSHPVLRRNAKGLVPMFWEWEERVHEAAQLQFPECFLELSNAPLVETEEENLARLTGDIPLVPLMDDRNKCLDDAAYAVVMALPAPQRARAEALAIRDMQAAARNANQAIALLNTDRALRHADRRKRDLAKIAERPKMAAWLVSEHVMPATIHDELKADGRYIAGEDGVVPAHVIMEIACRVLGGVSLNNIKMRMDHEAALRSNRQDNLPTHLYNTNFKRCLRKCVSSGSTIPQTELIAIYIYGLNLQLFEDYIRAYGADTESVPDTVGAVMANALEYLKNVIAINPALSKVLDHSTKAFVAYATEEVLEVKTTNVSTNSTTDPEPSEAGTSLGCQLCGKLYHVATGCFKLKNAAFVQSLVDAMPVGRKPRRAPGGDNVSAVNIDLEFEPLAMGPSDREILTAFPVGEAVPTFDLEHDDHAEISVLNEGAVFLLESMYRCEDQISGVVPGAGVTISQRGSLKLDMGRAVIISGATRLLVSGPELRKAYHWSAAGSEIRYTHKQSRAVLIFRHDPVRFGDPYYHLILEPPVTESTVFVGNLDFYDPHPLIPVPRDREMTVWPLIRAVERFHWTTNHMGAADMRRMCSSPGYIGEVTPEAVDLFVSHRGCSACVLGTMKAHSQLDSSRGLCTTVGETFQGDIFFVEADETRRLVPILLAVCEASLFMYIHVFLDALGRAQGKHG